MDRVIAANSVPSSGADVAPATGTPQFFTGGNPATGTPATVLPGYWTNAIQEEIRNVIVGMGITPDRTNNSQLLTALQTLRNPGVQAFNASGTFTVPANITKVKVTVVGGGSGATGASTASAYAGACGAGGGWAIGIYSVTPGQQIAVTVGAGGFGSVQLNASQAGGTSSFGSFCSATGGQPAGNAPGNSNGGYGGVGAGGTLNGAGEDGSDGTVAAFTSNWPGKSGSSLFGGGRRAAHSVSNGGAAPGAGGGAPYFVSGDSNTLPGAPGAAGIVVVEW